MQATALRASRAAGSQGGRPKEEKAEEDPMLERFERELARQGRAEASSTGGETEETDAAPKDRVRFHFVARRDFEETYTIPED